MKIGLFSIKPDSKEIGRNIKQCHFSLFDLENTVIFFHKNLFMLTFIGFIIISE